MAVSHSTTTDTATMLFRCRPRRYLSQLTAAWAMPKAKAKAKGQMCSNIADWKASDTSIITWPTKEM